MVPSPKQDEAVMVMMTENASVGNGLNGFGCWSVGLGLELLVNASSFASTQHYAALMSPFNLRWLEIFIILECMSTTIPSNVMTYF